MSCTNQEIRRALRKYIQRNGAQETRFVAAVFAKAFRTTKQRICGNISCLCCIEKTVRIFPNRPHSLMY